MTILQLCNKPPYPPVDGGTMAMNSITQCLLKMGCKVKVLSAYSHKHPFLPNQFTEEYIKNTQLEGVYFNLKINPLRALFCLLAGESYHVNRFVNKEFEKKLIEILHEDNYDIVHLESLFLTPYVPVIRKHSKCKVVLRSHNVEHLIWERIAKSTKNVFKRWYIKKLAASLRQYELGNLNTYDGIACISNPNADFFRKAGCEKIIAVVPFGLGTPDFVESVEEEENSLFHIGSMDWAPNIEGIQWFLKNVWTKVHTRSPQAKLYLAGREMPLELLKSDYPNVKILGEIPDAMYFIASKQINIVPLLSGSGIRVKIIEAMSVGKTVITTTIGAEGINYTNKKNILIANTPDEFVNCIEQCLTNKKFCSEIGERAQELVSTEYNNNKIMSQLRKFYEQVLHKGK